MVRSVLCLVLGLAGGLIHGSVASAVVQEREVAAIIIESSKGLSGPDITKLEGFIEQAAEFYPSRKLLLGKAVRKKFRQRVKNCELDVLCISRIARRKGLQEIIVGRNANNRGEAIEIQFLAISAEEMEIVRKVPVRGADLEAMQIQLARRFFSMVGISTPGYLEVEGAAVSLQIDGELASTADGPITLAPGPHDVTYGAVSKEILILPGEIQSLSRDALQIDSQPPPPIDEEPPPDVAIQTDPASIAPTADVAPPEPIPSIPPPATPPGRSLARTGLSYAGITAAGLGLGLLATSIYFGTQSTASFSPSTPQAVAHRRNQEAEDAAKRATIFMGVGAALVAAGGTLWILDNFVLGKNGAPQVSLDTSGSATSLVIRWDL